jgi:hypothetical protein
MKIEKIFKKYNIVSLAEAERLTGIPAQNIQKKLQRKTLDGIKIGRVWLIRLSELDLEKSEENT